MYLLGYERARRCTCERVLALGESRPRGLPPVGGRGDRTAIYHTHSMRETPGVMCSSSLPMVTNAMRNWAAEVAAVFMEAATSHVTQADVRCAMCDVRCALTIGRSGYE